MNMGNSSGQEKPAWQSPECPPARVDQSTHGCYLGCLGSRARPSVSKLEQQVAVLEREVQKQKELGAMYMKRLEKAQDHVRYCHKMAKESGFLDVIINPNDAKSRSPPPTPEVPANTVHQDTDLTSLIDRAKANGWYIEAHEIELLEQVAEGTTAIIYRGIWRGLEVAVKCMTPEFFNSNENGVIFFTQEVETLAKQRHCFVIQLMGACLEPPDYAWLVTELMDNTLKEWLHGPGKCRKESRVIDLPPLEERVGKALEISQAMVYLHEQKPMLIHRDLKPSNIFLDGASHVKIADFGHARFLIDDDKALTGDIGTYVYMAPEIFTHRPYDEKCDVFSFGIILNELITGNHPYIETDYGAYKIALEVAEGRLRPQLPEDRAEFGELVDLICHCWDGDASNRPSFATITCTLRKILKTISEAI